MEKNFTSFSKDKTKKDGYSTICKDCREKYASVWRANHRKENIEYLREYRQKNGEYLKALHKKWREDNRDEILKKKKEYYYRSYKTIQIQKQRIKNKEKRHKDISYKLRCNISRDVYRGLKQQKAKKTHPTWSKLPYTPQQLKEHLEKLWEPWMNWENYGKYEQGKQKWNIDHIIPQSKLPFNSMDHENFQKCWALENLRPLEIIENIRKGNK